MKIKTAVMLIMIFIFSSLNLVYAEEAKITCSTEVKGNIISINGQILNAVEVSQVYVLVGTEDDIVYVGHTYSKTDGSFSLTFPMTEDVEYGIYPLKIGSNLKVATYEGTLVYSAPIELTDDTDDTDNTQKTETLRNKFIDIDLDVLLNGYVPSVSGTVLCTQGKTFKVNILNETDNTVLVNETITSAGGIHNVSYTLPSLLNSKEYTMTFSCTSGGNMLTSANIKLNSKSLTVDFNGTVQTANNVVLYTRIQSLNSNLINKTRTFKGSHDTYETVPNILSNASFNLTAQGYETLQDNMPECEYTLNTSKGEESVIFINFEDVSGFVGRNIEIEFNPDEFTLTDGCAFTPQKEVSEQIINRIQIVSVSDGKLVFRFNKDPASEYEYSGTANTIKLMAKTDGEKTVRCKVTSE